MSFFRHGILFLIANLAVSFICQAKVINIKNQADFDDLNIAISAAIKAGDDIVTVNFASGEYFYKNQHVLLKEVNNPRLVLHFMGDNAKIVGDGGMVNGFNNFEYLYLKGENLVNCWSEFYHAKDTIEIVDAKSHLCRISHEGLDDIKDAKGKHIQVTMWFKSAVFPITKIDNSYIYFNAGDYAQPIKGYDQTINYDYAYAKMFPRYRLFGFLKTLNVYECRAACFLDLEDSRLKSLNITGISFNGCSRANHLFILKNVEAESMSVDHCSFSNIGGAVVHITNSNNVTFVNNSVRNTFGAAIVSNNESRNTTIKNNEFRNLDLKVTNSHGVIIQGADFNVSNNLFENFSYSAIGVGNHYKSKGVNPCYGLIKDNNIFLSGDYLQNPEQHTLMDGGAIYLWTQNDGITIEDNYIHDITGMKDNRGIFCDDGTKNVLIKDNIIERIANAHCISLRECAYVASYVPDYNSNNVIKDNYIDGTVRFFEKDSTCKYDGSSSTSSFWFFFSRPYWHWRSKR